MENKTSTTLFGLDFSNVVDILIKLLLLYSLLGYCGDILRPFLIILVWGGIIAIATHPIYLAIKKLFRGKSVLSSIFLTLLMLAVLIVPSWLVIDSLLEGIQHLRTIYQTQGFKIPPPPPLTQNWPSFSKPLLDLWTDASINTEQVIKDHSEQIRNVALWVFGALSGFSQGLLQFIASIIIAGIYFVYSDSIHTSSVNIFRKLAGVRGENFVSISITTIQNVVKGILGVAVIQSVMAGIGFFAAGFPFAGLWTILCLIFSIVQVGPGLVIIPAIIYIFSTGSALGATVFTVWMILTLFIDNALKPILLGRGAPVPMLVIFLGAIGGFISHGFIGLFLGAVILTLAYKLFETWIENDQSEVADKEKVDLPANSDNSNP